MQWNHYHTENVSEDEYCLCDEIIVSLRLECRLSETASMGLAVFYTLYCYFSLILSSENVSNKTESERG